LLQCLPDTPCHAPPAALAAAVARLPVFAAFLPSVVRTLSGAGLLRHTVYWGFDAGDPLLDTRPGLAYAVAAACVVSCSRGRRQRVCAAGEGDAGACGCPG
jgi:hypothetical protein